MLILNIPKKSSFLKIIFILLLSLVFLGIGKTIHIEAANTTPYNGYGKINTYAIDTSTGTGLTSGTWPNGALVNQNDGYSCYYMWQDPSAGGLGWSDPDTWYICGNSSGKWIDFKWNHDSNWYYLKNAWIELNGNWYFANDSGYLCSGWSFIPKTALTTTTGTACGWYYFDPDTNIMLDGWQYIDNKWYYLNQNDTYSSTDDEYQWGECLFDHRGISDLITVADTNLSYYGKTAQYITGFVFTVNTYIEENGIYSLESSIPYEVSLGSSSSCNKTVTAPIKTGYTINTSLSSPSTVTNSLYLVKNSSMASTLTKTDINWYYSPNAYTLSLHGNGGTGHESSILLRYNSTNYSDMKNNIPKREGYTFLGWYTAPTGGTQIYTASGKVVNDGIYWKNNQNIYADDYTLYAQWTGKSYTLTYNANSGTLDGTGTTSITCGTSVDLSLTCSKDGMLFAGWGLSPSDKKPLSTLIMPANHTTLYALYSPPVSDMKSATLYTWVDGNKNIYNSFPFTLKEINTGIYDYVLSDINLKQGLPYQNENEIKWSIVLYDNAGNRSVIGASDPPEPRQYLQTVKHYLWNVETQHWLYYAATSELVYENTTYTPAYLDTLPTGYQPHAIDKTYTVTGETITKAYYMPKALTLSFDANGGSCTPGSKTIYKDSLYGELALTEPRNGYTFQGWYTSKTGGTSVSSNDRYTYDQDTTLYAHWSINKHDVIYDYKTNGGNSVDIETKNETYGTEIDLNINAYKPGWSFIGWNTNPNATSGLTRITMPDEHVILYAIYSKDITATFVDETDSGTQYRPFVKTIYNCDTETGFTVPDQHTLTSWNSLGWSTDTKGDSDIELASGTTVYLSENQTFYGCYAKNLTISYNTNHSDETVAPQTLERFYNASGNYKNPVVLLAKAPNLPQHSFVTWMELDKSGTIINQYPAESLAEFKTDTLLTAKWDKYPEIEAYDRYFTLEDAQNGSITLEELFRKVSVTDKEDGILNEANIQIKNFNPDHFTSLTTSDHISITYQAVDSFKNTVEKTISIYVVDTTVSQSPIQFYARFISSDFYTSEGELISEKNGGLESTSIWIREKSYQQLLEQALTATTPAKTFFFSADELSNFEWTP